MAFCGYLKQGATPTLALGPFLDSTDGFTAETALSIVQADVRVSKNGGAFAQISEATTATHMENGYYSKPSNATDTGTLGILAIAVVKSGALPVRQDYMVVTGQEWDRIHQTTGAIAALGILDRGTGTAATSTSFTIAGSSLFANNTIAGATLMVFGGGQNYWQARSVLSYDAATFTVVVDAWTVTPSGSLSYVLFAGAPAVTTDDFNATQKASINAEVVDVLRTDTVAELTAPPAANAALSAKINWLFMKARNVITQTATTQLVKADDGTTTVGTSTVSDNGTTATRGEFS